MSTAMMSAPSSASRTAWLRPCPRAAPVMNATLPATLPATFVPFVGCTAPVGAAAWLPDFGRAGSLRLIRVPRVVGDQPGDGTGDVRRLDHVDRQRVGDRGARFRIGGEQLAQRVVLRYRGADAG